MKFEPDSAAGVNSIGRFEAQRVWVGASSFTSSVLVPWVGEVVPWKAGCAGDLTPAHFERVLAMKPEVVIFGSGTSLQFVKPILYRALIEHRIGLETMDTAAACRTYNVLASEGRAVVAALLIEG